MNVPTGPLLRAGDRTLSLATPSVMGVLNLTSDSFSDGGELLLGERVAQHHLRERAEQMVADGAALLDLGAESSRPGAEPVPTSLETERVLSALETLVGLPVILSVDTRKAAVAKAALKAGAHLINDIDGGRSEAMRTVLAASDAAFCLMHMQGDPVTMQDRPLYGDVVQEVALFLNQQVEACENIGIGRDRLLLDPGFGFGKTLAHNLTLLGRLPELGALQVPLLVGLSRKSMLGTITGRAVTERGSASIAAAVIAVERGACIVRAHDVRETVDALAVYSAVREARENEQEAGS